MCNLVLFKPSSSFLLTQLIVMYALDTSFIKAVLVVVAGRLRCIGIRNMPIDNPVGVQPSVSSQCSAGGCL